MGWYSQSLYTFSSYCGARSAVVGRRRHKSEFFERTLRCNSGQRRCLPHDVASASPVYRCQQELPCWSFELYQRPNKCLVCEPGPFVSLSSPSIREHIWNNRSNNVADPSEYF